MRERLLPVTGGGVERTWPQRLLAWLRGETAAGRSLRHVETLGLGGRRAVFLIECDGVRYMVAAGSDTVSAPVRVGEGAGAVTTSKHDVEAR